MNLFTIGRGKPFGISAELALDADRRRVLCAVVWIPRTRRTIRHFYPALTLWKVKP